MQTGTLQEGLTSPSEFPEVKKWCKGGPFRCCS